MILKSDWTYRHATGIPIFHHERVHPLQHKSDNSTIFHALQEELTFQRRAILDSNKLMSEFMRNEGSSDLHVYRKRRSHTYQ